MSLPAIFDECCNAESVGARFDMTRPFPLGEYAYATDSRIAVRARHAHAALLHTPQNRPPVERLPWMTPATPEVELPDVGDGMATCDQCKGDGKVVGYTPELAGGIGYTSECWECDGKGKFRDPARVQVGPVLLTRGYVALLRRHGVTRVRPSLMPAADSRKVDAPAVYFAGDGFEGLLLGCRH